MWDKSQKKKLSAHVVYMSTGAYFANKAEMKLSMSNKGFLNPSNPDQSKTPWIVKAIKILNAM